MGRVLATEWQKLRSTIIWVPVFAAPCVAILEAVAMRGIAHGYALASRPWPGVYDAVVHLYATLFLPLLAGVIAALCCRVEHLDGGWKQVLTVPVTRGAVYAGKFACVLFFVAVAQALTLAGVLVDGAAVLHAAGPLPWGLVTRGAECGFVATVPLAALQLWAASYWRSFGAPFALNVICTIPATVLGSGSALAPVYPWAQPLVAMLSGIHGSFEATRGFVTALAVAGGVFVVGGWLHFVRRDVAW